MYLLIHKLSCLLVKATVATQSRSAILEQISHNRSQLMSDDGDRLVGGRTRRDDRENVALRPKYLSDIIGQDRIRENLKIIIDAAKARQEPVDHILFYGPPGLGKTSLAHVVANEVNSNTRTTAGPSIERAG